MSQLCHACEDGTHQFCYLRDYQRGWMRQRRLAWIDANGPCARCGSSERLEADHRNREDKRMNASRLWGMSDENPVKIAELAKLQVLCNSCHKEKTRTENAEVGRRYRKVIAKSGMANNGRIPNNAQITREISKPPAGVEPASQD